MLLWSADDLKRTGSQFNQDLKTMFEDYCSRGTPVPLDLHSAAAFAILLVSNYQPKIAKRDQLLDLLKSNPDPKTAARSLGVTRWTPAISVFKTYSGLEGSDLRPDLARLIEMQRLRVGTPTWGSLAPDKIYALSQFSGLSMDAFDDLTLPFGIPVEKAFAAYTGSSFANPYKLYYTQLSKFLQTWAHNTGEPNASVLDIHSGLHVFGEALN